METRSPVRKPRVLSKLLEYLPTVEIRWRPSPAGERRAAGREALSMEVRTVLLDLGVGEPWRDLCALMSLRDS